MDWTKVEATTSVVCGVLTAIAMGINVWPGPQIKAKKGTEGQSVVAKVPMWLRFVAVSLVASFIFSAIAIYAAWSREVYQVPLDKLERVADRHFVNETVELDGKNFEHCTFDNVKLLFRGRRISRMADSVFNGTVAITTDSDAISGFGELLNGFEFITDDGIGEDSQQNFWVAKKFPPGANRRIKETFQARPCVCKGDVPPRLLPD